MNKILREKILPSKLAIQPVQDVIVVLASNQLNYGEKLASSVTSKAASVYSLAWNPVQL